MNSKKQIVLASIALVSFLLYWTLIRRPSNPVDLDSKNTLIVGTNSEFPPFSFKEKDTLIGFDIDVLEAIGQRLNKKIVFKDMPFDALIPAIQLGDIHMIAAGISPTPERSQKVFFTEPIFKGSPLVIVVSKNNHSINNILDLVGKTVVVNEGYFADMYISKIAGINVYRLSTALISEGLMALQSGRADAFVAALTSVKPFLIKNQDAITLHPIADTNESDNLAVSKHYPQIFEEVQAVISMMKQEGSLKTIKQKWFSA